MKDNFDKVKFPEGSMVPLNLRAINNIVDSLIVGVLGYILSDFLLGEGYSSTGSQSFRQLFFTWFVSICYYSFMEGITGQTVGKMVTKTKVVNRQGHQPEMFPCVLRSALRLVPFEAFTFFLWNPRGLHDIYSKTYVVSKDF